MDIFQLGSMCVCGEYWLDQRWLKMSVAGIDNWLIYGKKQAY